MVYSYFDPLWGVARCLMSFRYVTATVTLYRQLFEFFVTLRAAANNVTSVKPQMRVRCDLFVVMQVGGYGNSVMHIQASLTQILLLFEHLLAQLTMCSVITSAGR